MQTDHGADDEQCRRGDLLFGDTAWQAGEVGGDDALVLTGSVFDDSGGVCGWQAVCNELATDFPATANTHVENDGLSGACQCRPVEIDRAVLEVAGGKNDCLGVFAMGERNPGIRGATSRRRDAGNHFKVHAAGMQGFDLLATSSENEGVAAFETDDHFSLAGEFDQQLVDFSLGQGVVRCFFPGADEFGVGVCEIEGSVGNEVIVDNDVGGSDQPCGAQGQQIECARTAADKKDSAGVVVSLSNLHRGVRYAKWPEA